MDEDEDVEVSEMEKVFHNNLREQIVSKILKLLVFRGYLGYWAFCLRLKRNLDIPRHCI